MPVQSGPSDCKMRRLSGLGDWVTAGLATFSPPLDPAGNSVRGQLVTKLLSEALGLDILASRPVTERL